MSLWVVLFLQDTTDPTTGLLMLIKEGIVGAKNSAAADCGGAVGGNDTHAGGNETAASNRKQGDSAAPSG